MSCLNICWLNACRLKLKSHFTILFLAFFPVSQVLAKQDYTYVKSSLAFPWFIFFVIFALILIPFIMVVVLAWRKSSSGEQEPDEAKIFRYQPVSAVASKNKGRFNQFFLPTILLSVGMLSIILVLNAYEAMELMEQSGLAAPTMLNPRP